MLSYRKILLCYNGTREGRKALRQGADLALALNAEAHLLAVVDLRASFSQGVGIMPEVSFEQEHQNITRQILDEGVEWLTQRGLSAQGHLAFGLPVDEIAALAAETGADLVVVGHRCRNGFSRWWSGSSSASLIDKLSCSLLVACSSEADLRQDKMAQEAEEKDWAKALRLPPSVG